MRGFWEGWCAWGALGALGTGVRTGWEVRPGGTGDWCENSRRTGEPGEPWGTGVGTGWR